jgi:3-isopropylmalate/(R)-2-methylmalate dehydratase small subunit
MRGKAHVFGLNSIDPAFLAKHCMEDADAEFVQRVRPGDILVAGENFGCGSSREHAPIAIKAAGVACVVAESFARIFFRNSINIGLPIVTCPEAADDITAGDDLEIDLATGQLKNLTTGNAFSFPPFTKEIQAIIAAGGLMPFVKSQVKK